MSGSTARPESMAAGARPLGLKALGDRMLASRCPSPEPSLCRYWWERYTAGVVWNWHKLLWTERRERKG